MSRATVICLGNPHASDDGAALRAADLLTAALRSSTASSESGASDSIVKVGRPGTGLLDLLEGERPVVLVDVTRSGVAPGSIHRYTIAELAEVAASSPAWSSHGFGPGEALALARVLGRPLAPGEFIGIEGASFAPGDALSPSVEAALPTFIDAIRDAVARWE